jgi:hypothetical protein
MATLDDRDLRLERLKWATQRAKQQREYAEALAKQEHAKAQVLRTQVEQADAQLSLLDEQLGRLRITAPFDGISSQVTSVNSLPPVGTRPVQVAPLNEYRVVLQGRPNIVELQMGQSGELMLRTPDHDVLFGSKIAPISTTGGAQPTRRGQADGGGHQGASPRHAGWQNRCRRAPPKVWIWTHRSCTGSGWSSGHGGLS